MGFSADHLEAEQVRAVTLTTCGLKSSGDEQSLLTSLPSELCFNDLRDGERRAQKNAFRSTTAVCTAAIASAWVRSPLQKISLDSQDCQGAEDVNTLRSHILSNTRQTDRDLGIPTQDLTTKFSCEHLTKPHVLTQRLLLQRALLEEHKQDNSMDVKKMVAGSWTCRLLRANTLWRPTDDENDRCGLVIAAGPQVIRYIEMEQIDFEDAAHFKFNVQNPEIKATLRFDGLTGSLSAVVGISCEAHGLLLRAEAWLPPKRFLLTHRILDVPAGFVAQYCQLCQIGTAKIPHRERVKLLLESEGYPADYVEEVLENLPVHIRKPRKNDELPEAQVAYS